LRKFEKKIKIKIGELLGGELLGGELPQRKNEPNEK